MLAHHISAAIPSLSTDQFAAHPLPNPLPSLHRDPPKFRPGPFKLRLGHPFDSISGWIFFSASGHEDARAKGQRAERLLRQRGDGEIQNATCKQEKKKKNGKNLSVNLPVARGRGNDAPNRAFSKRPVEPTICSKRSNREAMKIATAGYDQPPYFVEINEPTGSGAEPASSPSSSDGGAQGRQTCIVNQVGMCWGAATRLLTRWMPVSAVPSGRR